ncbi:MAG: hypothetical protein GXY15_06945 [Candidatus Hydrogenedentes bacterium]|nr:hypothetical protein [Candidatus Hydrogenedentota bacterium]
MRQRELLSAAAALRPPGESAQRELSAVRERVGGELALRLRRRRDIERLIGGDNHRLMEHNIHNMLQFMERIFARPDAGLFVSTAAWSIQAQNAQGFRPEYWPLHFSLLADILQETLSTRTLFETRPFFHFLAQNHRALCDPATTMARHRAAG